MTTTTEPTAAPMIVPDFGDEESDRKLAIICSKGNLNLHLLRTGSVEEITQATRDMVRAVEGHYHIHSTADTPFAETPVENFLAFVRTARDEADQLA